MYNLLTGHLNDSNIEAEEQFQFRKILTSEEVSYALSMVSVLNNKSVQGGILCDLTKVFDCVHHDTSLSKLDFYQKTGKANE